MPSTRLLKTKDGKPFYEITVSRGRSKGKLTKRWYPPEGWSKRSIERELAAVAAEFERQCDSGKIVSRAEQREREAKQAEKEARILTLKQYGETVFMPAKTVTMSENARNSYQGILNRRIYPALGEKKLPSITPAQISALLLGMQTEGKAHGTVLKVYTVLQGLFKMAYLNDAIKTNPMTKVMRPKPRKNEVKPTEACSLTVDEVKRVMDYLKTQPLKWRVLIQFLIDTGVRRGECCALRWENIDFQTGAVTIAGNLCYTPAKGVYLDTPKNRKSHTVYVGEDTLRMLRELRQEQAQKAVSKWVFTQEDSPEPIHPQSPTRYLHKVSERCGVPDLHPHKMRHTFASIAITNGADIASVSEALGHSDKAITLRMYTHADQESISRAAQIVREAVRKAGQG